MVSCPDCCRPGRRKGSRAAWPYIRLASPGIHVSPALAQPGSHRVSGVQGASGNTSGDGVHLRGTSEVGRGAYV